jgi:uncharacterized protein
LDASLSRTVRTFQEFDDHYTAPIHGFRDAEDYWRRSSARQYLDRITVPTLLLNAQNDPFLTPECFPFVEAEQNSCLFFEAPESSGHLGFVDLTRGSEPWTERRVVEFLVKSVLSAGLHPCLTFAIFVSFLFDNFLLLLSRFSSFCSAC